MVQLNGITSISTASEITCPNHLHLVVVFGAEGGEREKVETALLGKRGQFQCNVQSSDASEVTLWWQFGGQNLTTLTNDDEEGRHHSITGELLKL